MRTYNGAGGRAGASGLSTAASGGCRGYRRAGKGHHSVAGRRMAGDRAGIGRRGLSVRQLRGLAGRDPAGLRVPAPRRIPLGRPAVPPFPPRRLLFEPVRRGRPLSCDVRRALPHGGHHRRPGAELFRRQEPAERAEARGLFDDADLARGRVRAHSGARLLAIPRPPLRGLHLLARPAGPDEMPFGPDRPLRARRDRLGHHPVDRPRGVRRADSFRSRPEARFLQPSRLSSRRACAADWSTRSCTGR